MPEIEDIIETTETAPLLLWWHWALIGIALAIILLILLKYLKQVKTRQLRVNNLRSALERLVVIEKLELDDTALATELSKLTREYLQHQFRNHSLFQTHREFVQDHADLDKLPEPARDQLANYLEVLANHKYLPDSSLPTGKAKLIQHTESLLRGIDSTILRAL